MKKIKIIKKIRKTIGKGRIEAAFDLIENSSEIGVNPDTRDVILQLKSNYSILKNKSIKGTISNERYNTELNIIIDNFLSFLKNINEVITYHEHQLQSGELEQENFRVLEVPKYTGVRSLWKRIKIFFSENRNRQFKLYLVKTNQYWIINCPEHVEVKSLSKFVADELFPNLKEQHFIWRLESGNIKISNLVTVQNSGITKNQHLKLTAEYQHHDELWGDDVNRKVVMEDLNMPINTINQNNN